MSGADKTDVTTRGGGALRQRLAAISIGAAMLVSLGWVVSAGAAATSEAVTADTCSTTTTTTLSDDSTTTTLACPEPTTTLPPAPTEPPPTAPTEPPAPPPPPTTAPVEETTTTAVVPADATTTTTTVVAAPTDATTTTTVAALPTPETTAVTAPAAPVSADPVSPTETPVAPTADPRAESAATDADTGAGALVPPPAPGPTVMPRGLVDTGEIRPITFPVAGPVTYSNDWGDCRDGCRRFHQGNDLLGDRLQPILAMRDGVIDHFIIDHPTAGYGVAIVDEDGWQYHVYHVNNDTPGTDDGLDDGTWRFVPGLEVGSKVLAGQVIAWMGDSGNSEHSVPHAHVEIHRPDGSPINPYWSLRIAQRDVNCASKPLVEAKPLADTTPLMQAQAGDAAGPVALRAPTVLPTWLASGWLAASLPPSWRPLELSGGKYGAGYAGVQARMWIGPTGYHPVDAPAVLVGDPRYDVDVDCEQLVADVLDVEASVPTELAAILATIRTLESGNNYSAQAATSTASGAYQFVDSTWNGFAGFARAREAPPAVQDAAAARHAAGILATYGGDVSMVPVVWYIGHRPSLEEWDTVPAAPGNVLTPREYQARWLDIYGQFVGAEFIASSAPAIWRPVLIYAECRELLPPLVLGPDGLPLDPQPKAPELDEELAQALGPIPLAPRPNELGVGLDLLPAEVAMRAADGAARPDVDLLPKATATDVSGCRFVPPPDPPPPPPVARSGRIPIAV
jgi:murein DD-endopeptidase MepM/ murein hydrolase activator NlpD